MDWLDIGKSIVKSAPVLGGLLGGSAGAAIGAVVSSVLGVGGTPDEVAAAISNDPGALVKLKQIEATRQVELQSLLVQSEQHRLAAETADIQAAAADRSDARQMQIATRSVIPAILAIGITLGFFGVLAFMLGSTWKPSDNPTLLLLVGSLSTSWGAVMNYYFGSSSSSARKDFVIASSRKGDA